LIKQEGYAWWNSRLRAAFARFDLVQLDHFRGFDRYFGMFGTDKPYK